MEPYHKEKDPVVNSDQIKSEMTYFKKLCIEAFRPD